MMGEINMFSIFTANTNPGSVSFYKTDATSRAIGQRKRAIAPQYRLYDIPKETAKVVETFGIIGEDGRPIMSGFKISDSRKDKDDIKEFKVTPTKYGQSLLNAMFKGWD